MTDDNKEEVTALIQKMSLEITMTLISSGLTPPQAMVVLGQTLAVAFKTEGVSKLRAVRRFSQLVNLVYDEADAKGLK